MTAETNLETTPLYGHISNIVTVSQRSVRIQQPEAKKNEKWNVHVMMKRLKGIARQYQCLFMLLDISLHCLLLQHIQRTP